MNWLKILRGSLWSILAALLLVGCGRPSNEQLTITFDEEKCTASGPSELHSGTNQFIVKNLTEDNYSLWVFRLRDGHTYQEVFDSYQGNEVAPTGVDIPDWLDFNAVSFVALEKDESTGEETITLHLKQEGDFATVFCSQGSTTTFRCWSCGPLKVAAAPTE